MPLPPSLIAATDWTVIGTAAVTATATILVAWIGYLGGSRQERKKLREERIATSRDARAQIYVDFLNAERGLESMIGSNQPIEKDRFEAWASAYTEQYNRALLLGNKTVRERVGDFHPIEKQAFEDLRGWENVDPDDFNLAVREAERQSRDLRRKERQRLIDAMRDDIAS